MDLVVLRTSFSINLFRYLDNNFRPIITRNSQSNHLYLQHVQFKSFFLTKKVPSHFYESSVHAIKPCLVQTSRSALGCQLLSVGSSSFMSSYLVLVIIQLRTIRFNHWFNLTVFLYFYLFIHFIHFPCPFILNTVCHKLLYSLTFFQL